ncbi:hypothetical protein SF83666_b65640 (plasmid) [Sinorhizobium fredii CCBAU 83666]|nr:hypothetical protein SF83666_b65640 [Sinorhizobium fredii CCBAU 83666]
MDRLVEKAADPVTLNGGEKFFECLSIGIEGVIPDGRIPFLVAYFEHPIVVGAGRTVNAQNDRHIIIDELAGEF